MSEKKETIEDRYEIVKEIVEIQTDYFRDRLSTRPNDESFKGQLGNWLKIESLLSDLMAERGKLKAREKEWEEHALALYRLSSKYKKED